MIKSPYQLLGHNKQYVTNPFDLRSKPFSTKSFVDVRQTSETPQKQDFTQGLNQKYEYFGPSTYSKDRISHYREEKNNEPRQSTDSDIFHSQNGKTYAENARGRNARDAPLDLFELLDQDTETYVEDQSLNRYKEDEFDSYSLDN